MCKNWTMKYGQSLQMEFSVYIAIHMCACTSVSLKQLASNKLLVSMSLLRKATNYMFGERLVPAPQSHNYTQWDRCLRGLHVHTDRQASTPAQASQRKQASKQTSKQASNMAPTVCRRKQRTKNMNTHASMRGVRHMHSIERGGRGL
jgi:hypothetical protein